MIVIHYYEKCTRTAQNTLACRGLRNPDSGDLRTVPSHCSAVVTLFLFFLFRGGSGLRLSITGNIVCTYLNLMSLEHRPLRYEVKGINEKV
jgi:hypothetical protein